MQNNITRNMTDYMHKKLRYEFFASTEKNSQMDLAMFETRRLNFLLHKFSITLFKECQTQYFANS